MVIYYFFEKVTSNSNILLFKVTSTTLNDSIIRVVVRIFVTGVNPELFSVLSLLPFRLSI
jgi:hypothetical protein